MTEAEDVHDAAKSAHLSGPIMEVPVQTARDSDESSLPRRSQPVSPSHTDDELEAHLILASQVQHALLPKPLTDTGPLAIHTLYLPADYVSGDVYEIARLDETRIGISLADVTGHGLPAALLTFLLRQSMAAKEILGHQYRILQPDEVLGRLNDDLLNSRLNPCRLVTGLHAVFDRATSQLCWARGGCPYPILIRPGEPAQLIRSEGGLIGAFSQQFQTVMLNLKPGETLLFHTDGVDALLLDREDTLKNRQRKTAQKGILDTHWVRLLEKNPPAAALQALRDIAAQSASSEWPVDDITVIALQMT